VRLHERVETEFKRRGEQRAGPRVVQVAQEQQDRVGAGRP
jgi:hypothetical protein